MFYTIFKSIQTALAAVTALKATQWFNMQYETTIAVSPVAFIEFPDVNAVDSASKDVTRLPYKVRVHVVTKVVAGTDGQVPDSAIQTNENIALAVRTALDHLTLTGSRPLVFSGWQHWQRYSGFMITYVDFTSSIKTI